MKTKKLADEEIKKYFKEKYNLTKKQVLKRLYKNQCVECGIPMVNAIDSITKKVSPYIWKSQCNHNKSLRVLKG